MSHKQETTTGEEQQPTVPNLQIQAMMGEMRRMMRAELEHIHERLDRVEEGTRRGQPQNAPNARRRERIQPRGVRAEDEEYFGDELDEEDDRDSVVSHRRYGGHFREARHWEDNNVSGIKMKIPSFQGKSDPEAYLEWEKKMKFVFYCHNYFEAKKVKLVVIGYQCMSYLLELLDALPSLYFPKFSNPNLSLIHGGPPPPWLLRRRR